MVPRTPAQQVQVSLHRAYRSIRWAIRTSPDCNGAREQLGLLRALEQNLRSAIQSNAMGICRMYGIDPYKTTADYHDIMKRVRSGAR